MNISKRNPLLRTNSNDLKKVIGDLGEELKDQNLEIIDGGSEAACGAVAATCALGGLIIKGEDLITQKYNCGNWYTATAECFKC
ncbi:plantaricin C family lantibiotic [Clostridium perfringens]|uniref:plantaricin C family lantibiotic n=1 Tax=Clostridium perfringens TaxID=1502 RepID=UPI0022481FC1|nr:plantaricin C family lantibiotic [Clostridium perfringens]MCX0386938.1 plantaricin C family lantibiotic [Clostridium perfringens]